MPGANSDYVSVQVLSYSVSVSLMVHVLELIEAPGTLIQYTRSLEVGLGVSDGTACHVDSAAHLDALLVP